MEITRTTRDAGVDLAVEGRLDGYWADHLDAAIAEVVREGYDRLRLDLSNTSFLSSAGIAVIVRHHKQLVRLGGSLTVANASEPVRLVLDMSRLTAVLCEAPASAPVDPATPATPAPADESRAFDRDGTRFDAVDLDTRATLTCRVIGDAASLASPGENRGHDVECRDTSFMIGIGAIGRTFEDYRDRAGDLLAVAGGVVYQPADGTNVPDYLVGGRESRGPAPAARMLYALACDGAFARLARFEPTAAARTVDLPRLASVCLELSGAPAAGVVIAAEVAGLVGAALRQSPYAAGAGAAGGFFDHPRVRERLTFTAERAFARSVALVAGIVARPDAPGDRSQLRPIGGDEGLIGHFHAAAFPFVPLRRGKIALYDTVTALFETERVLGVLHLVNDDRVANGAGANEFIRGACWTAPIGSWA